MNDFESMDLDGDGTLSYAVRVRPPRPETFVSSPGARPDRFDEMSSSHSVAAELAPLPFPAPRPAPSQEVRDALRRRGIAISSAQLASVLAELDADGDERVSRAEFEAFARRRRAQIRDVFRGFDRDGDGRVTSKELRDGVERAGLKISDEQLRLVFRKIDRDGSGSHAPCPRRSSRASCSSSRRAPTPPQPSTHFSIEVSSTTPRANTPYPGIYRHTRKTPRGCGTRSRNKLAGGGVAGAVSRTATAPVDRIKTIMQSGRLPVATGTGTGTGTGTSTSATTFTAETAARARSNAGASSSRASSAPPTLRSAVAAVYREGGARAFWRGNGANVVKVVPETAVKFVAFDVLKHRVARDPGNATVSERFAAGGLAGAAAQAAIYPLEMVKTRMALSSGPNAGGMAATALAIARESGRRALPGFATLARGHLPLRRHRPDGQLGVERRGGGAVSGGGARTRRVGALGVWHGVLDDGHDVHVPSQCREDANADERDAGSDGVRRRRAVLLQDSQRGGRGGTVQGGRAQSGQGVARHEHIVRGVRHAEYIAGGVGRARTGANGTGGRDER